MVEERYQQAYENKEIEFFVERDSLKGIFSAPKEWMREAEHADELKQIKDEKIFGWIKIHISLLEGRHYVPYTRKSRKDEDW